MKIDSHSLGWISITMGWLIIAWMFYYNKHLQHHKLPAVLHIVGLCLIIYSDRPKIELFKLSALVAFGCFLYAMYESDMMKKMFTSTSISSASLGKLVHY